MSEAGEGLFSEVHTFHTTKSVPPALKGKVYLYKNICTLFHATCVHVLDGLLFDAYAAKLVYYRLAPKVVQMEGNVCEVSWESIPPMKGDPIIYILQVLVGRESDYKQVRFHFSYLNCLYCRL